MNTAQKTPELVTIAFLSKLKLRSESAIRRAIYAGRLRAQLVDGRYLINLEDFGKFLVGRVVESDGRENS